MSYEKDIKFVPILCVNWSGGYSLPYLKKIIPKKNKIVRLKYPGGRVIEVICSETHILSIWIYRGRELFLVVDKKNKVEKYIKNAVFAKRKKGE